jgi:hypothetical protein
MRRIGAALVVGLVVAACGGTSSNGDFGDTASSSSVAEPTTVVEATSGESTSSTATDKTTVNTTLTSTTSDPAQSRAVCKMPTTAGLSEAECEEMTFHLEVPADCLIDSCGVIVDVHPTGMTWETEERGTSLRQLGPDAGYIVVQPQSPHWEWNYTVDASRIRRFLDRLIHELDVDPDRVHIGGASGGGFMAWT